MIYTLTLNPALDYVIRVDNFGTGKINRVKEENIYYGGKGINVSWILRELDIHSTALGFIAGFTGKALREGLEKQGISTDLIEVAEGMTRINVKMHSDDETEITGTGPVITEEDLQKLMEKTSKLKKDDILVLSGSIPSCLGKDTYERIIAGLPEGVMFTADAEKELLLKTLKYKPFLIKPNHIELGEMFSVELKTEEDIVTYARKLQEAGARNVLISMAKDGALLLSEDGNIFRRKAAQGTVVNSVGAGDSMVAGFLGGWLKSKDYAYALKLGTACGGATAFHSGLATGSEIREVLQTL